MRESAREVAWEYAKRSSYHPRGTCSKEIHKSQSSGEFREVRSEGDGEEVLQKHGDAREGRKNKHERVVQQGGVDSLKDVEMDPFHYLLVLRCPLIS